MINRGIGLTLLKVKLSNTSSVSITMESLPPVRRVVTAHNGDGISVVQSSDYIPSQVLNSRFRLRMFMSLTFTRTPVQSFPV